MSRPYETKKECNINDLVKSFNVINITEDGEFKKFIIKEGKGIKPIDGDEIEFFYQPPMDIFNEKVILDKIDSNSNQYDMFIAIKSMKAGEKAKFFISQKYRKNQSKKTILSYEMELLLKDNQEKVFLEGKQLKEKGAELFKKGDIKNACCLFQQAQENLNQVEFNKEENKDKYISLYIAILSNLCNFYNSMKDYNKVINTANEGLKIKEYSKFYYFRAIAYAKNNELENAKKDLISLKKILGEKKMDEGVKFLEEIIEKKEKQKFNVK